MRKFNVKVNGKAYEVEVEEAGGAPVVSSVQAAPVQTAAPAPAAKPAAAGGTPVPAPMPGLVLKLLVANGSAVKKNDKVLVLEAMKMENDILATADGVITFSVKEGDSVETGTTLASIN